MLPQHALPLSPAVRTQQGTELKRRIRSYINAELEVQVTDNRSVMLSVRRDEKHKRYRLRIHHVFARAPEDIIRALALHVMREETHTAELLHHYIEANGHHIRDDESTRRTVIRTKGEVYDLDLIFSALNHDYFANHVRAQITWGPNRALGRARVSVRLGSFTLEENLIRVHPGLDRQWVPECYLEWVVYHEMLHVVHPMPVVNGRRQYHTPAFQAAELRFARYKEAHEWERRNVSALLRI